MRPIFDRFKRSHFFLQMQSNFKSGNWLCIIIDSLDNKLNPSEYWRVDNPIGTTINIYAFDAFVLNITARATVHFNVIIRDCIEIYAFVDVSIYRDSIILAFAIANQWKKFYHFENITWLWTSGFVAANVSSHKHDHFKRFTILTFYA